MNMASHTPKVTIKSVPYVQITVFYNVIVV